VDEFVFLLLRQNEFSRSVGMVCSLFVIGCQHGQYAFSGWIVTICLQWPER
jgi:hypothetical protein